jgi:CheY-like chemotaxis protein
MTMIDFQIGGGTPLVACHSCEKKFDLLNASWCDCDRSPRTLICPHCSTCFCRAGARYKERIWNEAPKALRQNTNRFRLGDGRAAQLGSPMSSAPSVPYVLVVDDEEDMRSLVTCYVEQMGYAVSSADGSAEALNLLAGSTFDVVITDALMPAMDGRELCQKIKSTYGGKIKVVLMTSLYTANRYKTEARYRFGVDEYLTKPLHFSVLKAALDRVAPLSVAAA